LGFTYPHGDRVKVVSARRVRDGLGAEEVVF